MKTKKFCIAAIIVGVTASPAQATPPRISQKDAMYGAKESLRPYSELLEQKLVVGSCRPSGTRSRSCMVRVGRQRYVVFLSYNNSDHDIRAVAKII